ncbi:PLAC8 family-domain-containing protein, partial [Russula aff. rugulosa BPL654]
LSCCCCCHVYSRNKRRLDHLETHGTPLREPVERYNHDCVSYFWLQFFLCSGWILSAISRSNVRRRYGIRGDAINDVLLSGCCHPCELVQEHREIQLGRIELLPHEVVMLATISCIINFTTRITTV